MEKIAGGLKASDGSESRFRAFFWAIVLAGGVMG